MKLRFSYLCLLCVNAILVACKQTNQNILLATPSLTPGSSLPEPTLSVVTDTVSPTANPFSTGETTPSTNEFGYSLMTDDQGHLMVYIPKADFQMGFTSEQAYELCADVPETYADCDPSILVAEAPAHTVTLSNDYWMDVYEVTNLQYQACVEAGTCTPPRAKWISSTDDYYQNPEFAHYPVVHIIFEQAQKFCSEWREGHLPSEAEWEYAARGTDGRLWP